MSFVRMHCRWLATLALMAMLGLALVPTLSHALARANGAIAALGEVCTPEGLSRPAIDTTGGRADGPQLAWHALEHCPLCPLAAAAMGPPPSPLALRVLAAPALHVATPALQDVPAVAVWLAAQPRAPPPAR